MTAVAACLVFGIAPAYSAEAEPPPLVLSSYLVAPYSNNAGTGWFDQLVREAFRRTEQTVNLILEPENRGAALANAGVIDGHYARTLMFLGDYPNLLPVPISLYKSSYVALSKRTDITINGWASLRPFSVGYEAGWKVFESQSRNFGKNFSAPDMETLFRMLDSDRLDVVLVERKYFQNTLSQIGDADLGRRVEGYTVHQPPLSERDVFLLLHERHAARIPDLRRALKTMALDGTFANLCPPCAGAIQ